jgi:hypothetical protein
VGIGWGTYVRGERYYLDFAGSYDFLLFWQQNAMRKLLDQTVTGIGASSGDLYLHGMDLSFSVYF